MKVSVSPHADTEAGTICLIVSLSVKKSLCLVLHINISAHLLLNKKQSESFSNRCFNPLQQGKMPDMIDDLSRLSPMQKPSLNSRAAIVCGMSPIDLSSIFS